MKYMPLIAPLVGGTAYLVVWSGSYESPDYYLTFDKVEAYEQAEAWKKSDADDGCNEVCHFQVLEIHIGAGSKIGVFNI